MPFLVKNTQIQSPDISQEALLAFLKNEREPLRLTGIHHLYAVFESSIKYPITNKTKARYYVTCYIPVTDPLFNSEKKIEYIFPSKVGPYVAFNFDSYTDNSGVSRSWIE